MEIKEELLKPLAYYLSRSMFKDKGQIANIVAEEAVEGNELALRAMEARRIVMDLIDFHRARGGRGLLSLEATYKKALDQILDFWVKTQDLDTPPIQWAEEMAGIACDALEKERKRPDKNQSSLHVPS